MTALVWALQSEGVVLGMDSMSIRAEDRQPHKYCSKILALPHIAAVVCGTGSPRLALEWYLDIQLNALAQDIDYVNEIAPERLADISARLAEPGRSTIYHFGYSPREEAFMGMAFRSSAGFAQDRLRNSVGVKPGHQEVASIAPGQLDQLGYVNGIVDLVARLREVDDSLPAGDRVGIGGEVHVLMLSDQGLFQQVVYRWPDFADIFNDMLERLNSSNEDAPGSEVGV